MTVVAISALLASAAVSNSVHYGRTLAAAETSRLFGGTFSDRQCGVVESCEHFQDCKKYDGDFGPCEEYTKYLPVTGSNNTACNVPVTKGTNTCTEGATRIVA